MGTKGSCGEQVDWRGFGDRGKKEGTGKTPHITGLAP